MHRINVDSSRATAVVEAAGELDAFAAPDLEAGLAEVTGRSRVVVDLSRVSFLDSTALGVVVRALRRVDESRGAAAIVLPQGAARRIFEITTLDKVLPVAPSRADAIDLVGAAVLSPKD